MSDKMLKMKPPVVSEEVIRELADLSPRLAASFAVLNRKKRTVTTVATVYWRPVQFSAADVTYWLEAKSDQKRFERRLEKQVNRLSKHGDKTVIAYKVIPEISEGEFSYRIEVKNASPDEAFPFYRIRFTSNEPISLALEGGQTVRWSFAGIEYEFPAQR